MTAKASGSAKDKLTKTLMKKLFLTPLEGS